MLDRHKQNKVTFKFTGKKKTFHPLNDACAKAIGGVGFNTLCIFLKFLP